MFHRFRVLSTGTLKVHRAVGGEDILADVPSFQGSLHSQMHLLYISRVVITSSITGWYHVTVAAVVSWETCVAQLTLPSLTHNCNIYINIIKIVDVD